jgi:hypothetical protein
MKRWNVLVCLELHRKLRPGRKLKDQECDSVLLDQLSRDRLI